ncbi:MAG: tyrosine-type recombinase/integrase [Halioglobus sp.]
MLYLTHDPKTETRTPWNKGKLIGQRPPLKLQEIWSIRIRLELAGKARDLALFNLAIDSKLRSCDLITLKLRDISVGGGLAKRAMVMQQKTGRPVQFEITDQTRESLRNWIRQAGIPFDGYLFTSKLRPSYHLSTRQYSRLVKLWVSMIGLEPAIYGTHSLRRTKVTLIYKRTKNIRAVQLLLGHTSLESTVRYLGVEVDDALEMAEQTEI